MQEQIKYDTLMLAANLAIKQLENDGCHWNSKLKDTDCSVIKEYGKHKYQFTAAYAKQVVNRLYLIEYCDIFNIVLEEFNYWWITNKPKNVTEKQMKKDVELVYNTLLAADELYECKKDNSSFDRSVELILELLMNRCKLTNEQVEKDKKAPILKYGSATNRSEIDDSFNETTLEELPVFSKEERDMLTAHCDVWDKKARTLANEENEKSK